MLKIGELLKAAGLATTKAVGKGARGALAKAERRLAAKPMPAPGSVVEDDSFIPDENAGVLVPLSRIVVRNGKPVVVSRNVARITERERSAPYSKNSRTAEKPTKGWSPPRTNKQPGRPLSSDEIMMSAQEYADRREFLMAIEQEAAERSRAKRLRQKAGVRGSWK